MKQPKFPLYLAFAVPFTLQVLGIVGLVGYISYRSAQQAVEEMIRQLIAESGHRVIHELDHYLKLPHQINRLQINALESGTTTINQFDLLHQYMIGQHREFSEVVSLGFATPQGQFLVSYQGETIPVGVEFNKVHSTDVSFVLGRSEATNPTQFKLYATNANGKPIQPLETLEAGDVRQHPWYRRAVETRKPGWSQPFQDEISNRLLITGYTPLYDHSNNLEGVFSSSLSLEALSQFLDKVSVHQQGQVFIIDRKGFLVAASSGELLSHVTPEEFQGLEADQSANLVIQKATQQLGNLQNIQSAQEIAFQVDQPETGKERHFLEAVPYQDDYGLDWLIVTTAPEGGFMGEIHRNLHQTIAWCALALLGSMGLGWWSSRRIARSLRSLSESSQDLAQGNFNQSLPRTHIEELDTLSESFHQMATALQRAKTVRDDYEQTLEQKIEEKTAALQAAQQRELKATTQELKLLEQILETTLAGYWDWDICNGDLYMSPGLKQMLGYEEDELPNIFETWQKLIVQDDLAPMITSFKRHANSGGTVPHHLEVRYRHKNGSTVWVICTGQVIAWDQAGNPLRMIGAHVDITESKQTQLTLEAREIQLQLITDSVPGGISYVDASLRYQFVNQTYEEWFGCCKEEILGRRLPEVMGEEAYHRVQNYVERALAGERVVYEAQFADRGGATRYISAVLVPALDEEGTVEGYYAMITDITARKEAEIALQKTMQELQALLDNAPVQIALFDAEGRYLQANPAVCELLGVSRSELVGKTFREFLPEATVKRLESWLQTLIETHQPLRVEDELVVANEFKVFESVLFPILNAGGEATQFCAISMDITERKQMENLVQSNEERLHKIFAASNDAIFVIDPKQDAIVEANPKATQLLGYSLQELVTRVKISDLYSEEMPNLLAFSNQVIENGQGWTDELSCRTQTNQRIPIEISATCIEWNEQTALLAIVRNISERKAAEANLKRQLAMIEAAADGIAILEGETYFYINQAHLSIFGYEHREELLGQTWRTLYPSKEIERFEAEVIPILERDRAWKGETLARRKDGSIFPLEVSLTVNEEGLRICVCQDITARKEVEKELEATTHELDSFFSMGVDLHCVANTDGYFLRLNQPWQNTLGYPVSALEGSQFLDYVHPDDLERTLQAINHLKQGNEITSFVNRYRCQDGSYRWIEWRSIPNGNLIYAAARDITAHKETEMQLVAAKEAAEKTAKAKSEFLATMSHEIRTPMNGILGMLQVLHNSPLTPKQRSQLDVAYSSAESLLSLINDILDFSKVDAGKLQLEATPFYLTEALETLTQTMAFSAQKKGLEVILDLCDVPPQTVKADPSRLKRILTNLVGNAIKFTEDGEILIRCQLNPVGNQLRFTGIVQDTGIGIPEEKLSELFEPFTQADASTTRKYGGTGLGLAIVKKLCNLMEGTVNVESKVGQGSCFTFEVTLQASSKAPLAQEKLDQIKVLTVVKNESHRRVLSRQLEAWGVSVITAADGKTALSLTHGEANSITVALIDSHLPDMPGIELGQRLRNTFHLATMRIILMSPMTYSEQFSSSDSTSDGTLKKPILPSALWQTLTAATADPFLDATPKSPTAAKNLASPLPTVRVLLVEDDPVNQLVFKGMMEEHAYQVDIASDGKEALQQLRQASPDAGYHLVLMDCQMPELDGYETARQIRAGKAGEHNQNLPIIAMTAYAMTGDKEKCIAAGMNDYISKPLVTEEVMAMLAKWSFSAPSNGKTADPAIDHQAFF